MILNIKTKNTNETSSLYKILKKEGFTNYDYEEIELENFSEYNYFSIDTMERLVIPQEYLNETYSFKDIEDSIDSLFNT